MITVLQKAVDQVRTLSKERQEYAAEVLGQIVAAGEDIYRLTDEERRLVREGIADLDADRVISEHEMGKFWDRHRS